MRKTLLSLLFAGAMALFSPKSNGQNITYYPPLDSKVEIFKQPNQLKPSVWDTLLTWNQKKNTGQQYVAIDSTDTTTYRDPGFISGNFAFQLYLNFHGWSGFIPSLTDTTTFNKYNLTNVERFNVPLYRVGIYGENGFTHGMNWFFAGDNPIKGDIGNESPLDIHDGIFVEPQNDSIDVQSGTWNRPLNCTIDIHRIHFYIDENNQNRTISQSFLKFFLTNGQVDSVWHDPKLVLERNKAPANFKLVSPADSAKIASRTSPINFAWRKSIDPNVNDSIKYGLRVKGKDNSIDTTIANISDTVKVLNNHSLVRGNYEWSVVSNDGEFTANSDTLRFSIGNTAPTQPTYIIPTDKDTIKFNLGKLLVKYTIATDADNDTLTYTSRIRRIDRPGLDTLITTRNDSTLINDKVFEPLAEYRIEGKVFDVQDTIDFTSSRTFYTPLTTGVERLEELTAPSKYSLSQNYPNPFNPSTKIRYSLEKPEMVSLKVYDVLGREVETLVDELQFRGTYVADFNASKLPSGVYMYRLKAGDFIETKKMVVNK